MSIRIVLICGFVAFLAIYAYRDWFKSLCGLILVMAVLEHPEVPKNIMGIQGLNPWNILFLNVFLGWLLNRRREGLVWDMPANIQKMLLIYLAVILVGFVRMMMDRRYLDEYSTGTLISEHLINTLKWVVPGLLLFDGCRTRQRLRMALACILVFYVLLAVLTIRYTPSTVVESAEALMAARLKIDRRVGYHAVNLSAMFAGACWALLTTLILFKQRWRQVVIVGAAMVVAYAQARTGGRMGYATWGIVGLLFCALRWRRYLILAPVVPLVLAAVFPAAADRMLQGFGQTTVTGEEVTDDYQVTAGRTLIWPYVVEKIAQSPIVGYGRLGMNRTGVATFLREELSEAFPHPHNMYLEMLLDNGLVGFCLVLPFYVLMVRRSTRLFLSRDDPLAGAVGGTALALVLAQLVAGMGSQSFYPREGTVCMWAAIGLMLRVSLEFSRVQVRNPDRVAACPVPPMAGLSLSVRA